MAIIDLDTLCNEFPNNRIVLIDGKELICYPRILPEPKINNELSLDETGTYLNVKTRPSPKTEKEVSENDKILFLKNAFLFYRNAQRILNDSRMFLAPVPIQSGLAYSGTSGFQKPTLGVYIEWWLNCETSVTKDREGEDALTYYIAGSPLSGTNSCSCVYPDGRVENISHFPFRPVWSSFIQINKRYDEAKVKYEAYSLEEVVHILAQKTI